MSYGADVVICLDDCTHVDDPLDTQQESVQRTIEWARRSKVEFNRLIEQKDALRGPTTQNFRCNPGRRGIQDLRKQCADALLEIGFDGFGYGGWPLDGQGNLLVRYSWVYTLFGA